jgi:hypothetical protein
MICRTIGSPLGATYTAATEVLFMLRRERFSVWATIFPEVT